MDEDQCSRLETNQYTDWCFEKLEKIRSSKANKAVLTAYQNVSIYYSALGVRRSVTMSGAEKKLHAARTHEDYVAEAYLKWLKDVAGHTVPEWLTKAMLGRSTLTGPCVLFDKTKDALWRKYGEIGGNIRAVINPIVDEFTVDNNSQTELPSGEQAPDLMEYLHREVWARADGKPQRMKMAEYHKLRACGQKLEIVDTSKRIARRKTPTKGKGKGRNMARKDVIDGATSDDDGSRDGANDVQGSTGGDTSDGDRSEASEKNTADYATPPVAEGTCSGTGNNMDDTQSGVDVGNSEEIVTVVAPMPEDHLLPNALVFAFFGKFSSSVSRDPDLDLQASEGPSGRKKQPKASTKASTKRKVEAAPVESSGLSSTSSGEGKLSSRGLIKLMVGAGESQSRAEMKAAAQNPPNLTNNENLKRKLCELLENQESHQSTLSAKVGALSRTFERKAEIDELKDELQMCREIGDLDGVREVSGRLRAMFKARREGKDGEKHDPSGVGSDSAIRQDQYAPVGGGGHGVEGGARGYDTRENVVFQV